MKEENAKEVLRRLWGTKDTYGEYEVLNAMIEYATMNLDLAHQRNVEIIEEVMKCMR